MHFEFGLKNKEIDKKKEPNTETEQKEEKPKIKYSETNIGYDSAFSKRLLLDNPKDIFYESEQYLLFDKTNPKMYLKDIVKLSMQEKQLFKKFFEFIKELPITNTETELENHFLQFLAENKIKLDHEQLKYLHKLIDFEINHFGPLTPLLQDKDQVEEIAVIGLGINNPVYAYVSNVGWTKTNFFFTNEDYLRELINKMARNIGRQISINSPMLNASLPDGSRLNAIIPPISNNAPSITLRRFKFNPLTPLDLIKYNTFSDELCTFLWLAMLTDSNILIAGNTGSGKTTTLNALFSFVPKSERIIICEETPEVNIPHEHQVRLKIDDKKGINMNELIVSTLRMRPDRLIVGEIRTKEEVHSFIDTMLAGQGKGSFATFHGLSSEDTVERLMKLGMLEQDLNALDLIILQRRWNTIDEETMMQKEIRKIIEVCEIQNNKIVPIYKYDFENNVWNNLNKSKKIKAKIEIIFRKPFDEIFSQYQKRIYRLNERKHNMNEFFEHVNNILWDKHAKK